MFYVYLIRSVSSPERTHIGFTHDIRKQLAAHNAGEVPGTADGCPWEPVCYQAFADERRAQGFKEFLQTDAGQVFAREWFW